MTKCYYLPGRPCPHFELKKVATLKQWVSENKTSHFSEYTAVFEKKNCLGCFDCDSMCPSLFVSKTAVFFTLFFQFPSQRFHFQNFRWD